MKKWKVKSEKIENEKRPLDILEYFIFNDITHDVRILWEDGDPLFKALDIAKILEIKNIHTSMVDFDSDEKALRLTDSPGGIQKTIVLTELGLYRLIFTSRKPIAKPFKKWVAKLIRDIQKNGKLKWEIENLKKELEKSRENEIISVRNATHNFLLQTFHNKRVVYFARFDDLDGKIFVKIGSTKNLHYTFTQRHEKDYGDIKLIHVIESRTRTDFEYFLLHHPYISKLLCREPVKLDGGVSIEVILATQDELNKVLRIANRNAHKYPNAVPDVKKDILEIQTKMESDNKKTQEQLTEIRNLILNSESIKEPQESKKVYKRELGTGKCSECNVRISNRAKKCLGCFERPKKFEITKENLHDLVITQDLSYEKIGRMYNVSGKTIRKRCVKLDVELPKRYKKIKRI